MMARRGRFRVSSNLKFHTPPQNAADAESKRKIENSAVAVGGVFTVEGFDKFDSENG
jgi:hypothetical protein